MYLKFIDAYKSYENYIELRLKAQSKRAIKNRFKVQILPYWENYDIYSAKEIDYLNWQLTIEQKNYSYKYKQALHIAMVTFFNFCKKFYELEKNIASNVGNFKRKNEELKIYNHWNYEDFKKFIKNVDNLQYKRYFECLYFTGVRPGEGMALRFSNLENNILKIRETIDGRNDKTTKTRLIGSVKNLSSNRDIEIDKQLNNDLLELKKLYIKKYGDKNYDYFIFGGIKPLAPTTINRHKSKACEKANLKPIRLHDFRHSHATLLVENNMNIKEISRRLGHSNVQTTLNIYVHADKSQEKRVINTLNSLRLN